VWAGAVTPLKAGYEFLHRPRAIPLHRGEAAHEGFDLVSKGLVAQYAGVCRLALCLNLFIVA
jgi:hypothetical protein